MSADRILVSVDLRHARAADLGRLADTIRQEAGRLIARRGLQLEWQPLVATAPVATDPALRACVTRAAGALGYSSRAIVSGAGHDAMAIAARCPVAMIFTPCRGGVSHRPDEYADVPMIEPGFQVLTHTLAQLAWDGE